MGFVISPGLRGVFVRLASLRLTLACFVLLAAGIIAAYYFNLLPGTWAVAVPLFALAVNLLAAIMVQPSFRRNRALLFFHLFLLVLVVLVATSRMTYLRGWMELTEGIGFSGKLDGSDTGPWHRWRLSELDLTLLDFTIDYYPLEMPSGIKPEEVKDVPPIRLKIQRGQTRARFQWKDGQGQIQQAEFTDMESIVLKGYRISLANDKGFAPVFGWQRLGQAEQLGSIHLPSYPRNVYNQAQEWTIPGTRHKLWTQLQFDENFLDTEQSTQFRPPPDYTLILRDGEQRYELRQGDTLHFPEGRLRLKELRTWMTVTVDADWTLPWLLACILAAVFSLGVYLWQKSFTRPWNETMSEPK